MKPFILDKRTLNTCNWTELFYLDVAKKRETTNEILKKSMNRFHFRIRNPEIRILLAEERPTRWGGCTCRPRDWRRDLRMDPTEDRNPERYNLQFWKVSVLNNNSLLKNSLFIKGLNVTLSESVVHTLIGDLNVL